MQQRHHVAAKVLGAGDTVIEDAHDAFEAVDCCQLIELFGHCGVTAHYLANVEGEGILRLGDATGWLHFNEKCLGKVLA